MLSLCGQGNGGYQPIDSKPGSGFRQIRVFSALLAGLALLSVLAVAGRSSWNEREAVPQQHVETSSGLVCHTWANSKGEAVQAGRKVMTARITEKMEVSFTLKTPSSLPRDASERETWQFFQLGATKDECAPCFWFYSLDWAYKLEARIRHPGWDSTHVYQQPSSLTCEVRWTVDGLEQRLFIGGRLVSSSDQSFDEERDYRGDVPVYVGPPSAWLGSSGWFHLADDAVVRNLKVCWEEGPTTSPTPAPTLSPTVATPAPTDATPAPTGCRSWSGGTASKGQRVLYAALRDDYNVRFKFTVYSTSSGWANIFHFGGDAYTRQPALFLHKDRKKRVQFSMQTSKSEQWNHSLDIELNSWYTVEFQVRSRQVFFSVKGPYGGKIFTTREFGPWTIESRFRSYSSSAPVYVGCPWYSTANAKVENLEICY